MTEKEQRDLLAYLEDLVRVTEVQKELIDSLHSVVKAIATDTDGLWLE
jgi:hypothetical protein